MLMPKPPPTAATLPPSPPTIPTTRENATDSNDDDGDRSSFVSLSGRIKDGVWAVFSKEKESQEVRAHALRPLRELLKLKPPSLAADTWNVSTVILARRVPIGGEKCIPSLFLLKGQWKGNDNTVFKHMLLRACGLGQRCRSREG